MLSSYRTRKAASSRRTFARLTRAMVEPLEQRRLLTRFAIIGDMGESNELLQLRDMIVSWNPEFITSVGDINNQNDTQFDETAGVAFHNWIYPYVGNKGPGSTSGNRFWPTFGNHDWGTGGFTRWYNYWTLPGNERYYNIVRGDVEFFFVNSDEHETDGNFPGSTQYNWLQQKLAQSTARWKIVHTHHPPYSSGGEGSWSNMQWPYQQWGATAVISGHSHVYERILKNGFPYITNGLGGWTKSGWRTTVSGSQFRYNADFGAMLVDTSDTGISFKFYKRTGELLDQHTVGTVTQPPPTSSVTFIPTGASWKYLDNGSNQGTAWRATSFSDSTWKTGNAQLGYGDGDEATLVSFGGSSSNKFVTTYFRRSFSVTDKSAVTGLNLRLKRDDGAVVYLNGTEVFRSNMPTGTIGYTTFASSAIEDEAYKSATINSALLANGNNVIAVEVHQADRTSSDLSFDFELTGTASGTTVTAPSAPGGLSASAVSSSQVNLSWSDNSSNEGGFKIERSTNGTSFTQIATTSAGATSYNDTGRSASTTYWYRVRAYNSAGDSSFTNTASATTLAAPVSTLPAPWTSGDVGNVGAPGSATFANNVFSITASGADVWSTADSFHYLYQPWTGNGQIIVRALTPGAGPSGSFEGIMFRETLASNSKHASILINNGLMGFVRRTTAGGSSSTNNATATTPMWIKLIRNGSTFTAWRSSSGTSWTQLGGSVSISMTSTIHVGLLGCSTVAGHYGSFSFDGVQTSTSTSTTLAGTLSTSTTTTQSRTSLFSTTGVADEEDDLLALVK